MNARGDWAAGIVMMILFVAVFVVQVIHYVRDWSKGRKGDER